MIERTKVMLKELPQGRKHGGIPNKYPNKSQQIALTACGELVR